MKYVVEKKNDKVISFLLDDAGHAVEIHADDPAQGPKIGDIYIGLVQKVAKHINAAFVELVPGINGYLPFDEIVCPIYVSKGPSPDIQAGDQLVVQITREAFGQKDLSLSTRITLRGKHTVLILGGMGLGVSKKIPAEQRQELKDRVLSCDAFTRMQDRIGPCQLVVRTSAGELLLKETEKETEKKTEKKTEPDTTDDSGRKAIKLCETVENSEDTSKDTSDLFRDEILQDIAALEAEMIDLKLKAPYRSVHSILKKQPARWISRIVRLSQKDADEIVTDDVSLYRRMLQAAEEEKREDLRFRLYSDSMVPMEKVYSLEREWKRALDKRVNLKCGGDLVIESTEALHIIDVNSGRSQSSKQKEEALLAVNLEAAREAARQIRLRNLSGIIVIDFINLKKQKNSLRILDELRRAVQSDPVRTNVIDMTKLGLVELTRQKIEVPLKDTLGHSG